MKIIITLALLFSFAFSTVHEFAFAFYDEDHCSASEYAQEIESPSKHHDICDTHFEYHHAYLLPQTQIHLHKYNKNTKPTFYKESYKFLAHLDYIKPPIS